MCLLQLNDSTILNRLRALFTKFGDHGTFFSIFFYILWITWRFHNFHYVISMTAWDTNRFYELFDLVYYIAFYVPDVYVQDANVSGGDSSDVDWTSSDEESETHLEAGTSPQPTRTETIVGNEEVKLHSRIKRRLTIIYSLHCIKCARIKSLTLAAWMPSHILWLMI